MPYIESIKQCSKVCFSFLQINSNCIDKQTMSRPIKRSHHFNIQLNKVNICLFSVMCRLPLLRKYCTTFSHYFVFLFN